MPRQFLFSLTKKDFDIQTFCSGGPGGQHQNKTESGIRIVHIESRAVGESRSERSQHQNKRIALKRLVASQKFKIWLAQKNYELTVGKINIEKRVDEAMKEENIKAEVKNHDGKWISWNMFEESIKEGPEVS